MQHPRRPSAARPTAIALALLSLAGTHPLAQAQETQVIERVEITGSIIRRSINDEAASTPS